MKSDEGVESVQAELAAGMALPKCQKCGCMQDALHNFAQVLPRAGTADTSALAGDVSDWIARMRPVQYKCLGCEHCYPAAAQDAFGAVFPALADAAADLSCEFRVRVAEWPVVPGEYAVVDSAGSVAVSTLASVELAEALAARRPAGLCIAGKTETENIGIDKVIKNVITSPTLRYLIVAGAEPKGHLTGQTLLALAHNGADESGRVVGSAGKHPILRNVSASEISAFRDQVQVIDLIGNEKVDDICTLIEGLAAQGAPACGCAECSGKSPVALSATPTILATEPGGSVKMDKAGYFVVVPLKEKGVIHTEQYSYDNSLLRVIEGSTARSVYAEIVANGWVTELSHAAYLGKELAKAELSLQHGFRYIQDGA